MKTDPFLVERWMNTYEYGYTCPISGVFHNVEYNLAETCVDPFTLAGFLEFVGKQDFFDEFQHKQLTYGYIEGNPKLREGITNLYEDVSPDNVLVTGGAIEANFNSFYSLVEPGDGVVIVFPTYQQLFSVPRGFMADVKLLTLTPENGWLPDLEELKGYVNKKTKMIVINNPNNPCGSLIDTSTLRAICEIAEDVGAYVHSDEAYRGLYIDPKDKVPSVVDIYEKGIAVGSFSKPFSLTGLRLGWITSNEETVYEFMLKRDYTTISKSMLDEALAAEAMPHIDRILERNNRIARENWKLLDDWISNEPLLEWVKPRAGSVAFMKQHTGMPSKELCLGMIEKKSTFLVPGECFEHPDHIRIGYGNNRKLLEDGLEQVSDYLREHH
jgi:aspartate/methionine/tyrosine aminotransferase